MRTPVLPYRPSPGPGGLGETFRAVSLPVFAGLLVRAIPVLSSDFPLNDGGLFYTMTRDLQQAHDLLPATTSYNGLAIPFVYPPLGFYLAGWVANAFGVGLLAVFQVLPLIVGTLTIPAIYLLARELLATRFQALLATWAFALLPRAFAWLVVGGGLTRSLGYLFAILAILEGVRLYRTRRAAHVVGTGAFAALTVLSHPQAAEFIVLSMLLVLAYHGRSWRGVRDSVIAAGLAALLTLPWWWTVISTHGLGPFISGGQTGLDLVGTVQYFLTLNFTDEPYLAFMAALAVVGALWQLARRRYLLPAWVFLLFLIDPRAAGTSSMIPVAMLIAVAVDEALLGGLAGRSDGAAEETMWPAAVVRDRFGRLALGAFIGLGVVAAVGAPTRSLSPLHSVPVEDRAVMAWIATNTPSSARFLVVTGNPWFIDADSEWFPVLADRQSLATLQGYEWLGKEKWLTQGKRNDDLASCAKKTADCIVSWASANEATDAWVYLPRQTSAGWQSRDDCCPGLRESLIRSAAYEVAYDSTGGTVFRPRH